MKHIRKIITTIVLAVVASVMIPVTAGAQAQINTKKVKISDFTQKTTKVVLTGNSFLDVAMKDEIASRWRISPYEFCTLQEFNELKNSEDYYFLIPTKGQFRKEEEPGILFLTLVKGGKKAESGIDEMLEIVSIPVCSAESPSGREMVVLPAYLDIIQDYTLASMEKDINAYSGLMNFCLNLDKAKDMKIVFAECDLSDEVDADMRGSMSEKGMEIMDEDDADDLILNQSADAIVSYVVAPTNPQKGSYCYKLLIDTANHKLYYYRKHRISKTYGAGFLKEDIRRIAASR
ncbi:MAG: hypothetical protein ACI3ZS_07515 [Candidatus Cryptobacteroides sp.]